jgi:hypothetical protein
MTDEDDDEPRPARIFDLAELARDAQPKEVTSATFSYVDAMLTGKLSDTEFGRIRDEILGEPPPAPDDPHEAAMAHVHERMAAGDYVAALHAAERVLEITPDHEAALRVVQQARSIMCGAYQQHLGAGHDVPQIVVPVESLAEYGIDRWAAYILSRVDGKSSIDGLVAGAGFTRLDTLRLLYELVRRGIVAVVRGTPSEEPVAVARIRLARRSNAE